MSCFPLKPGQSCPPGFGPSLLCPPAPPNPAAAALGGVIGPCIPSVPGCCQLYEETPFWEGFGQAAIQAAPAAALTIVAGPVGTAVAIAQGLVETAQQGAEWQGADPLAAEIAATTVQSGISLVFPTPSATEVLNTMGLDLSGIFGGVSDVLGGFESGSWLGALSGVTEIASAALTSSAPAPVSYPMSTPTPLSYVTSAAPMPVANVPAVIGQPKQAMTKEVFDALSKVLSKLGIQPKSVSGFMAASRRALSSIASFARRTPTGTIVSVLLGLGLTAYEANLLTAWHAQRRKHRRMNPANSKALRRAARRIKSFHRLCVHTDVLKSRGRRSSARCRTCKGSPCRC